MLLSCAYHTTLNKRAVVGEGAHPDIPGCRLQDAVTQRDWSQPHTQPQATVHFLQLLKNLELQPQPPMVAARTLCCGHSIHDIDLLGVQTVLIQLGVQGAFALVNLIILSWR